MPQQSNESSATPRPWIKVPQGDGSFVIAREFLTGKQMAPRGLRIIALVMVRRDSLVEDEANADLIFTAVNAYDENQATIETLKNMNAANRHALDSILNGIEKMVEDDYPQDKFSSFDPVDYVDWIKKKNQATIEKQGKVIKDLVINANKVERYLATQYKFKSLSGQSSNMWMRLKEALNSIPKEML